MSDQDAEQLVQPPQDKERIREEMGEHGDTRTMYPRLVCRECDNFVYLTRSRDFKSTAVRAECNCLHGDPTRGDIPAAWIRINEYVDSDEKRSDCDGE